MAQNSTLSYQISDIWIVKLVVKLVGCQIKVDVHTVKLKKCQRLIEKITENKAK